MSRRGLNTRGSDLFPDLGALQESVRKVYGLMPACDSLKRLRFANRLTVYCSSNANDGGIRLPNLDFTPEFLTSVIPCTFLRLRINVLYVKVDAVENGARG